MKTPLTITPLWIDAANEDPVEVCLVVMHAIAEGRVSDPQKCAQAVRRKLLRARIFSQ
jgi:hypothetical protein